MNASHLSYINSLNNVEAMLRRGIPTAKTGVRFVDWLNVKYCFCSQFNVMSNFVHQFIVSIAGRLFEISRFVRCDASIYARTGCE